MNAVRIWAAAVCAAAIAASIAQLAVPEGKVQKAMRCVIGLFFVCCVVTPFAQGLPLYTETFEWEEFSFTETTDDLSQELMNQTVERFKENVHQIVQDALLSQQIFPTKIEIDVHVEEDSSIYISSLKIQLEEGEKQNVEKVSQVIQKETGMIPEIWVEGEEVP